MAQRVLEGEPCTRSCNKRASQLRYDRCRRCSSIASLTSEQDMTRRRKAGGCRDGGDTKSIVGMVVGLRREQVT
jgi:hypothetical protein